MKGKLIIIVVVADAYIFHLNNPTRGKRMKKYEIWKEKREKRENWEGRRKIGEKIGVEGEKR